MFYFILNYSIRGQKEILNYLLKTCHHTQNSKCQVQLVPLVFNPLWWEYRQRGHSTAVIYFAKSWQQLFERAAWCLGEKIRQWLARACFEAMTALPRNKLCECKEWSISSKNAAKLNSVPSIVWRMVHDSEFMVVTSVLDYPQWTTLLWTTWIHYLHLYVTFFSPFVGHLHMKYIVFGSFSVWWSGSSEVKNQCLKL